MRELFNYVKVDGAMGFHWLISLDIWRGKVITGCGQSIVVQKKYELRREVALPTLCKACRKIEEAANA